MECIKLLKEKHAEENTDYTNRAVSIVILSVADTVPNRPSPPEDSAKGAKTSESALPERRTPSGVVKDRHLRLQHLAPIRSCSSCLKFPRSSSPITIVNKLCI